MNTTNTDFYAYQFKPVLNFLDSPCNGLLIADEVGLGKTIEAGLIWTEIRSRYDARRLLVVCPAMLRDKWKRELSERFQVDAQIASAKEVADTLEAYKNGVKNEFHLIVSLQGIRPPTGWQDDDNTGKSDRSRLAHLLKQNEHDDPLFDMVVVDEAHYLRNQNTKSAEIARLLRAVSDNLLLLSATPIQLKSADLYQLLNLLDENTFGHEYMFEQILEANAPLIKLRDRLLSDFLSKEEFLQQLTHARSHELLAESLQLKELADNPPSSQDLEDTQKRVEVADKIDRVNALSKVISRTRKRDVMERRVVRQPFAYMAEMHAVEMQFYEDVTQKVREYCADRKIGEGLFLTIPQRQMCSSMAAACRLWQQKADSFEEAEEMLWELGQELEIESNQTVKPLIQELASIAREKGDYATLKTHDSKYSELLQQIRLYWDKNPNYKIVLFSYFRGTLTYLHERLGEDGINSIVLMGGQDKEAALKEFASPEGPNILLSSEVASEGVDLQFSSLVINYDLPWNPMKIEQRIGRIDRIGQVSPAINIWNIFCKGTLDERVYVRLFVRLGIFEQALGSIEAILGDEITNMSYKLLSHDLTPEQEGELIEQTRLALARNYQQQGELEEKAVNLVAHGHHIQEKVKAARDLHRYISDEDLWVYFKDFMSKKYPGCEIIQQDVEKLIFNIKLSSEARVELNNFIDQYALHGKTQISSYDNTKPLSFLFENKLRKNPPRTEIISQYHPVIRFISNSLKNDDKSKPYPVVAVRLDASHRPEGLDPGLYVFAAQRWLFSGARDVESLAFKATPLNENSFLHTDKSEFLVTTAAMRGQHWIGAGEMIDRARVSDSFHSCIEALEEEFESKKISIQFENSDRISFQLNVLEQHYQNQKNKIQLKINVLRASGKTKIIPAEEGKLKKLLSKIEDKKATLLRKQNVTADYTFVTGGIIEVL